MARTLVLATFLALVPVQASADPPAPAPAAPSPFGPVASINFYEHPGTTIEQPKDGCGNADILIIRGTGLGNAKSADITPKTSVTDRNTVRTDKYGCNDADCLQITIKLASSDATGTRTVTIKHNDGRTLTTTFDVTANAGRCDYKTGKK